MCISFVYIVSWCAEHICVYDWYTLRYVQTHTCYVYMYAHMHTNIHPRVCLHTYTPVFIHISTPLYIHMHIHYSVSTSFTCEYAQCIHTYIICMYCVVVHCIHMYIRLVYIAIRINKYLVHALMLRSCTTLVHGPLLLLKHALQIVGVPRH